MKVIAPDLEKVSNPFPALAYEVQTAILQTNKEPLTSGYFPLSLPRLLNTRKLEGEKHTTFKDQRNA